MRLSHVTCLVRPLADLLPCTLFSSKTKIKSQLQPLQIINALPSLEALPRLTRLGLHHNRIGTLPALDCLLRLPRLRALLVSGSPVASSALLRPYVAYR